MTKFDECSEITDAIQKVSGEYGLKNVLTLILYNCDDAFEMVGEIELNGTPLKEYF